MLRTQLIIALIAIVIPFSAYTSDINQDLLKAVENGQAAKVKTLLAEGADPNARADEYTVLARAAEQGYIDIVRILVKAGAEVNPMNEYPAMFYAAMRGQTTVVKVLLEAGAEVNATGFSRAALVIAADAGHTDTVQALLDAGADVNNSRYYNERTALLSAAGGGHIDIVRVLLDAGAEVKARNVIDKTAMMAAAEKGHFTVMLTLLKAGAEVKAVDRDGCTTLMYAAHGGNTKIAKALLSSGANVDARDNDGRTSLMKAAMSGNTEVMEILLDTGADVNIRDNDGRTALKLVRIGAQSDYGFERDMVEEEINLLLEAGANSADLEYTKDYPFPLLEALSRRDLKTAESLISTGKAIVDDSLSILLHYTFGSTEVREFIRDHGPQEIADGSLNLLDIFIGGGIEWEGDPGLHFPLATTFLHDSKQPFRYSPGKAFDDDITTSWVEGVKGSGIGEKIAFNMDKKTHTISVLPGYGVEKYFRKNNRVKQARLTVYTIGSQATVYSVAVFIKEKIYELVLNFEDSMRFQNFKVDLPESGVALLEITAVYTGTAYDDTCMAEISLYGEDGEKIN